MFFCLFFFFHYSVQSKFNMFLYYEKDKLNILL